MKSLVNTSHGAFSPGDSYFEQSHHKEHEVKLLGKNIVEHGIRERHNLNIDSLFGGTSNFDTEQGKKILVM